MSDLSYNHNFILELIKNLDKDLWKIIYKENFLSLRFERDLELIFNIETNKDNILQLRNIHRIISDEELRNRRIGKRCLQNLEKTILGVCKALNLPCEIVFLLYNQDDTTYWLTNNGYDVKLETREIKSDNKNREIVCYKLLK